MVKKQKETPEGDDNLLANAVRSSAQQIWQAGLGAFAKAQEEGGRVFNKLVQEGTELQKRSRLLAEDRVSGMSDTVAKVADGVGRQAAGSWDKLEQVFEDRVARALATIGVPNRKDIEALAAQVEQLSATLAQLTAANARAARPAAKKAVAKAPAAKVARKAALKPAAKAAAGKAAPRKAPARKAGPAPGGGA